MMQDRAIVTTKGQQETASKHSNGTSLNDNATLNNLKMVQHTARLTVADQ